MADESIEKKKWSIGWIFDKLGKTGTRLGILITLIVSIGYLQPKVKTFIKQSKDFLKFQTEAVELQKNVDTLIMQHTKEIMFEYEVLRETVKNLDQYHSILTYIIKANSKKVTYDGHTKFGVELIVKNKLDGKLEIKMIEGELREMDSGDVFLFIEDGYAKVYSATFYLDKREYYYIDFKGRGHWIEPLD